MVFPALVIGVVTLTIPIWQSPTPVTGPAPGNLRWARGLVTAAATDSVTLQLKTSSLLLAIDPSTQIVHADSAERTIARVFTTGSLVEVHYTDKSETRRGVLILVGAPGGPDSVSKRPGRSYRGIVSQARRGTLSLRVETRNRSVKLDSKSRLTGAGGESLATGSKAIAGRLSPGEEVLVTWEERPDDTYAGEFTILSSAQTALEIRRLRTE
jgi:hypothetical protein